MFPSRRDYLPLGLFAAGVLLSYTPLALLGLALVVPSGIRWYRSLP